MRRRIPYLFGEKPTVLDVVEAHRSATLKALDEIDSQELQRRPIEEIAADVVRKYRLDMPVLDRANIVQFDTEEIDIDVSNDPRRMIIPGRGPYLVKGSKVSIAIPFAGDPDLFKCGNAPYPYTHPIVGELEDQHVVLSYESEHPDAQTIKTDFDNRIQQIEQTLNMGRDRTEEWNRELERIALQKLTMRKEKLSQASSVSLGFRSVPRRPVIAQEDTPIRPDTGRRARVVQTKPCDLFLSHASEDKQAVARPLYEALVKAGLAVWFDEAALTLGDSLRQKIDEGLARCQFGVVILSPTFFAKQWPQRELDGLVAKETTSGAKAIIPIWHDIDQVGVARFLPTLADRLAGRSDQGIDALVGQILTAIRRQ